MQYVPGYGSASAKIIVVGEAPGAQEERDGRPFVGPSGQIVDKLLLDCGVHPDEVYKTNVVKIRPPGNNIKALHVLGKSIDDFLPQLWEEIAAISPNVILAFGNTALQSLTGKKGIEKWRGSILQTVRGYPKVVATLHPASLLHAETDGKMRSWKDLVTIRWDVERAVRESKFPELNLPRRDLRVCKSSLDAFRFFESNSTNRICSVDIETYRTIPICIAFAFNSSTAMSIPLFDGMGRDERIHCWRAISEILNDPKIRKIGQNFKFDGGLLEYCINGTMRTGLKVNGFFFDTMLAFKVLYPELSPSLQYITSVLTDEPYYKDEGKEYNPHKDDLSRLLLYNAKDAVVTYEAYERELEELRERGLEEFFFTRQMPLHPFYSAIERRGILQDKATNKLLDEKYKKIQGELEEKLLQMTGVACNVSSPKQVTSLLFGHLGLPPRKGTDEKTLDALKRNATKDPLKKSVLENILEQRKVKKTRGTYIKAKSHPDGRIRTGYRIILETGRTSTSVLKPPVTTESLGIAFQNITKHSDVGHDIRTQFIPDPGYVFIEPDLSQAEARIVACLARDRRLEKLFEYSVDIHRITAAWIDGCAPDEALDRFYSAESRDGSREAAETVSAMLRSRVPEQSRQLGKRFRHAGHYDMGKREASIHAKVSEWKAGQILEKFHKTNPNIREVFHKEIVQFLGNNNRTLTNPFGRQRQFFNRWGDELFKEAYSQIPQSTVSDHLKFAMLRIEARLPYIQILQESHDSFLAQIELSKVDKSLPVIQEELETPIDMSRCSLPRGEVIIPCEIKIGEKNWKEMRRIV